MPTLTTITADTRLLLDDPGTDRYTSALIAEGISLALAAYSQLKPLSRTYVLDSTGSKRITLPADFEAKAITAVEWESDLADFTDDIAFYATRQDEQWILELPGNFIPVGEIINIGYETSHTIDGLDGAAGTTIPDEDIALFCLGAAGFSMRARATSKVEDNNLNMSEAADLAKLASNQITFFLKSFGNSPSMPFASASWHIKSIDKAY